jgi:hypothetical protein
LAVAAAVVSAGLATPAFARLEGEAHCTPGQETVSIEQKVCPATAGRPALVVERACCMSRNGKMRCAHFSHCPKRSPS